MFCLLLFLVSCFVVHVAMLHEWKYKTFAKIKGACHQSSPQNQILGPIHFLTSLGGSVKRKNPIFIDPFPKFQGYDIEVYGLELVLRRNSSASTFVNYDFAVSKVTVIINESPVNGFRSGSVKK